VFNKIDSSYVVSIRSFVALCPNFSTSTWPLPLRSPEFLEKGEFSQQIFGQFSPEKNVSAFFSLDYYTAPCPLIRGRFKALSLRGSVTRTLPS